MANEEHLKILNQGVEVWNKWRKDNPEVIPDLRKAALTDANLTDAHFLGANLTRANLSDAFLYNANLSGADLSGADLSGTDFSGAYLYNANLTRADLSGAYLTRANLSDAFLYNANLSGADLYLCSFKLKTLWWRVGLSKSLNKIFSDKNENNKLKFSRMILNNKLSKWFYCKCEKINVEKLLVKPTLLRGSQLRLVKLDSDPILYRDLLDEQYLDSFEQKHKFIYWFWLLTSNCGRSISLLAVWSAIIGLLFGFLYYDYYFPSWLPHWNWLMSFFDTIDPKFVNFVNGVNFTPWWEPFYLSFVTMTTLGLASANPINTAGFFWHTFENIIGYLLLGYLIAVFGSKFTRRSG